MKAVLFDLDGTLLPMNTEAFMKAYFGGLSKKLAPRGYEPQPLVDGVWKGTYAMVKNDGTKTNEQAFWDVFCRIFGEKSRLDIPYFDEFYRTDFNKVKDVCGFNVKAGQTIKKIKSHGYKVVVATNPLFPMVAQQARLNWAGVDLTDIDYITSYENSHYCKPNSAYYNEIVGIIGCSASDCVMVGNDVAEDMIAGKLGMKVFLLPDCIINADKSDISAYPQGGFDELLEFIISQD